MTSEKSNALEGIRGIAALIVVFWHATLGFMPSRSGIFNQWPVEESWQGSPVFLLLNAHAAVVLFFVLSGYVLTAYSFKSQSIDAIHRNAIKRWPRLAGPVLAAILLSYAFFKLDCYQYEDAARLSQSPWLARFAYAYKTPFVPDFWAAVRQGLFNTFIYGESFYNSSLWTMKYEFFGSFIVLAVGYAAIKSHRPLLPVVLFLVLAPILTFAGQLAFYIAFLAGCALSSIAAMKLTLPRTASCLAIPIGLYLFGYAGNSIGNYNIFPAFLGHGNGLTVLQTVAAILILGSVILTPSLNRALNTPLMKTLGRLSFPIYLVHVPIICSIGSWAYIQAFARDWPPIATAFAATIVFSLGVAIPFAIFNELWVKWVNTGCDALLRKTRAAPIPSAAVEHATPVGTSGPAASSVQN